MVNVAEWLFLLAFWAPPVIVAACALLLLVPTPTPRRPAIRIHATAAADGGRS